MDKKGLKALGIEREKLLEVLKAVYTLTGIKISLYDTDNHMILSYPEEQSCFCRLVREQELRRCLKDDADGFARCQAAGKLISYNCHAGLREVIAPLKQNGNILGYIMFGQMLQDTGLKRYKDRLVRHYAWLVREKELIEEAVDSLTVCREEEIQAAALVVEVCITYLLSRRIVFLEERRFMERLDAYIDSHLGEELNPEMLCSYLDMHRTALYSAVKRVAGCGVMSYIRSRRMKEARRLLIESRLSVTEIAEQVGFGDYNYFLRVFKRETGVSCRIFRRQNQSV